MDIQFYKEEEVKCRLISYERCSKTTITFFNKNYNQEKYNTILADFKNNPKIFKISKIENGVEEVIFEKQTVKTE